MAQLSKATLKSLEIFKYDYGEDKTFPLWNAYECLVAEVDIEEKTYILSSGQWLAISDELKNKIKDYLQNNDLIWDINYLPENVSIYDHKREQNREEVYNLEAAKNQENLYLFDKAKLTIGGKKDYEVCDLLHNEKHLIHVKRYTSGAASISHIFTQVKFYSDAFSTEKTCREEMREWIQSNPNFINNNKIILTDIIPEENSSVVEPNYKILFCILYDDENFNLNSLPLMSQYELMNCHKYLTQNRKFQCGIVFKKVILGKPVANHD